jgi:lipopolysaccharide transport system ATP-binding protein
MITFKIDAWPNLREEEYSLSVAVADGTLNDHAQCHWLHDALIFRSIPIRMPAGIFSVINTNVTFFQVGD